MTVDDHLSTCNTDRQSIASCTDSWRDVYRSILPDAYLSGPIIGERLSLWQCDCLGVDRRCVLLAESGMLVGLCAFCGQRTSGGASRQPPCLEQTQRYGSVDRLFSRATQWVMSTEPGWPIHLWSSSQSRCKTLLRSIRGEVIENRLKEAPKVKINSLRYVWRDLREL
jgi:hypothetical protein